MFYTGVNAAFAQRACLAMSHIPDIWNKASDLLFTPFHGDTALDGLERIHVVELPRPRVFQGGRDELPRSLRPYPRVEGRDRSRASDDYFTWQDAGPLYVHGDWHALESPFLMKRTGSIISFSPRKKVGGVSHMASDSLRSGWNIVKRRSSTGATRPKCSISAPTRTSSRGIPSYSSAGGGVSTIRFDTLGWPGDEPAVEMPPPLEGWTILWGAAFDHQPVFGNNPRFRGDDTADALFEGAWWIGTYESFNGPLTGTYPGAIQGDGRAARSARETFTVTGLSMRLLVGGGDYPDSCYVALCDARSGEILLRETGKNTDRMDERVWNLVPFRGRTAYLTIVDDCGAPFGHINVDGIEERTIPAGPPPDGEESLRRARRTRIVAVESLSPAARPIGPPGPRLSPAARILSTPRRSFSYGARRRRSSRSRSTTSPAGRSATSRRGRTRAERPSSGGPAGTGAARPFHRASTSPF